MQICARVDIKVVIKPMTIIKDFLTHVLTHDSAKDVQKAVIASVNFREKKQRKTPFSDYQTTKNGVKVADDGEQRR